MPAKPLSPDTLLLIDALREALAARSDVEERTLFGSYCFFVDGKLCLGVKHGELLVRLPPERHQEFLEMQNTRELSPDGGMQGYFWVEPNGFATREHWQFWLHEALAYNPRAKASPRRKAAAKTAAQPKTAAGRKRHSVFDSDL
ncbi:MAG: TfoX/Sxy family protein [Comamonas sp.]